MKNKKEYKIYRDNDGNLTLKGTYQNVAFTVTTYSIETAEEALAQLQRFEKREGARIDKVK